MSGSRKITIGALEQRAKQSTAYSNWLWEEGCLGTHYLNRTRWGSVDHEKQVRISVMDAGG